MKEDFKIFFNLWYFNFFRYALYLLENDNLRDLWAQRDGENHNLSISGGSFLRSNPKLCPSVIYKFFKGTNNDFTMSNHTNGYEAPCKFFLFFIF